MNRRQGILAALLLALACETPGVAPGLDLYTCDAGLCDAPGVIQGNVVYAGPARGDTILLLFDTAALPPPDGTGTSALAVARLPASLLFSGTPAGVVRPFSAPFSFAQVPAGRSYQIRAFIDVKGEFDPFFDFTQSPRAGAPAGGYGEIGPDGQPRLLAIPVAAAQVVSGINVALTETLPYDPPSFVIDGPLTLDQNMDQPSHLHLHTTQLAVLSASFSQAHFGLEFAAGGKGTVGDGLPDVFPQVFLRQMSGVDASGNPVAVAAADAAIIPCRVIPTPVLPALPLLQPGAAPVAQDQLDVLVEPLAVHSDRTPFDSIPLGVYQTIVVEKSGQVWTVPNMLGDPARAGTPYYAASQAAVITVQASSLPGGSIAGNVEYSGSLAASGNIIVQAYLADPANPPPPLGAALPVRVQIIRAEQVKTTASGFTAPYAIDGLPAGNYLVQALADLNGNFGALALLQTPTKGDLVGAVIDLNTLLPKPIAVAGAPVTGQDVILATSIPLDPPAFVIGDGAQLSADSIQPARFTLSAQAFSFPIGASAAPAFTVALVRDPVTQLPVDADGDGLPDVWPRIFLVRLDPGDPTGLTQYKSPDSGQPLTEVIPAAVDPTPFLPALLAAGPTGALLATQVTVIARPALIDATNPDAKARHNLAPGKYKVVVINQTGQVWQIPNEANPAALDPSVVCAASATSCAPGTVQTQSQGESFQVTVPASLNAGAISGSLKLTGITQFFGAYVFAYDSANPPPPQGTGTPLSADYHSALEFSSGAVNYVLQNLPANRSYIVAAVVDTRGDFAVSPQLFAAAPGEGTVLGGHAGLVTLSGAAPVATGIEVDASAPGGALPPRPSFVLQSSGLAVTSDLTTLFPDALTPQRISLHAQTILSSSTAFVPETDAPSFLVSYQGCDVSGAPLDADFDNLPDLYPKILVVRLSDADPSGLTPDPNTTVIPAAIDPTRFTLGACSAHNLVPATDLSVILAPTAVQFAADGTPAPVPIPAGRYGIVLEQSTGQVWRVPNELQPGLLDPRTPTAVTAALASQGVAIKVSAQVPPPLGGSISGVVDLSGYAPSGVGNLLVAAYLASAPPPPLGLGRPVAVQIIPSTKVVAALAGGAVPYSLQNLPASTGAFAGGYLVTALLDPLDELSPLLSFMATPPRGTQAAFYPFGAPPAPVVVGSAPVGGKDLKLVPSQPAIPFERPAFSLDGTSQLTVSSGAAPGTAAVVKLDAGTPAGLPYAVAGAAQGGGGFFHPTLAICGPTGKQIEDPTQSCTPGQPYPDARAASQCSGGTHPWVATQVYATPLDTGSTLVAGVVVSQCQFCTALTGTADCSAAPLAVPQPQAAITIAVTNVAIDPSTKLPAGVALPTGHYAITVVEPTGQSWTLPNELGFAASPPQGMVFTVVP